MADLRQVQIDLIAIKVGVERGAVGVVHADRALALQSMTHQTLSSALAPNDIDT
jgi:hypothetical protein